MRVNDVGDRVEWRLIKDKGPQNSGENMAKKRTFRNAILRTGPIRVV